MTAFDPNTEQITIAPMMAATSLPVIDFGEYGLEQDSSLVSDSDLESLAAQLIATLRKDGFVYLKNHGIADESINKVYEHCGTFFSLPVETKLKYTIMDKTVFHGYTPMKGDRKSSEYPADLHESFNIARYDYPIYPSEVPHMRSDAWQLVGEMQQLGLRILDVLAIGLKVPERNFFSKAHIKKEKNLEVGAFRLNHYPPLPKYDDHLGDEHMRFCEHTDGGSISLLFFDDTGLEIKSKDGTYVSAPPVPGAVLVVVGNTLEEWTNNELCKTVHRVVVPKDEERRKRSRTNIALFVNPDFDEVLSPPEGDNKNKPFTLRDKVSSYMAGDLGIEMGFAL